MRLLHAWDATDRARTALRGGTPTRPDIRDAPVGKLLPLHRLSGDRRRHRCGCTTPSRQTERGNLVDRRERCPARSASGCVEGQGRYTDDLKSRRAWYRVPAQPPSHARIARSTSRAPERRRASSRRSPATMSRVCASHGRQLAPLPLHSSPPQYPLARARLLAGRGRGRGGRRDAGPGRGRAGAHRDRLGGASGRRRSGWRIGPRRRGLSHAKTGNVGLDHSFSAGDPDQAFRDAAVVVEHDFTFNRQTGSRWSRASSSPSSTGARAN